MKFTAKYSKGSALRVQREINEVRESKHEYIRMFMELAKEHDIPLGEIVPEMFLSYISKQTELPNIAQKIGYGTKFKEIPLGAAIIFDEIFKSSHERKEDGLIQRAAWLRKLLKVINEN